MNILTISHEEDHDIPEPSERTHQLDAYCWCRPEVVKVERAHGGALKSVQVAHRTPVPAPVEEPVAVGEAR